MAAKTCDICGEVFDPEKGGVACNTCGKVVCSKCEPNHMVPGSQWEDPTCTVCVSEQLVLEVAT
jgi:hypothetical protein